MQPLQRPDYPQIRELRHFYHCMRLCKDVSMLNCVVTGMVVVIKRDKLSDSPELEFLRQAAKQQRLALLEKKEVKN